MTVTHTIDRLSTPPIDLVLCSSGVRWRAALKTSLRWGFYFPPNDIYRLVEVDDLQELNRAIQERACAVVGLEIGAENLRGCLDWLTDRQRPSAPVVGLLSSPPVPADARVVEDHCRRTETLATLVREAGAVWTLSNPLQLRELLQIAAQFVRSSARVSPGAQQLSRAIWQSLPWQSTRRPLRLTAET